MLKKIRFFVFCVKFDVSNARDTVGDGLGYVERNAHTCWTLRTRGSTYSLISGHLFLSRCHLLPLFIFFTFYINWMIAMSRQSRQPSSCSRKAGHFRGYLVAFAQITVVLWGDSSVLSIFPEHVFAVFFSRMKKRLFSVQREVSCNTKAIMNTSQPQSERENEEVEMKEVKYWTWIRLNQITN